MLFAAPWPFTPGRGIFAECFVLLLAVGEEFGYRATFPENWVEKSASSFGAARDETICWQDFDGNFFWLLRDCAASECTVCPARRKQRVAGVDRRRTRDERQPIGDRRLEFGIALW